jgi:hypothetical protein
LREVDNPLNNIITGHNPHLDAQLPGQLDVFIQLFSFPGCQLMQGFNINGLDAGAH